MQTTIPLIQLDNIEKVFLTDEVETHALSKVSMEIRHGDYVSISGPSGCGKSTLLSILGLLDSPTSGSYKLRGEAVASAKSRDRVYFPEFQSDWRSDCLAERRTAADVSRAQPRRAAPAG